MTRLSKGLSPYLAASHKCVRNAATQRRPETYRELRSKHLRSVYRDSSAYFLYALCHSFPLRHQRRPIGCKLHTGTWWFDTP